MIKAVGAVLQQTHDHLNGRGEDRALIPRQTRWNQKNRSIRRFPFTAVTCTGLLISAQKTSRVELSHQQMVTRQPQVYLGSASSPKPVPWPQSSWRWQSTGSLEESTGQFAQPCSGLWGLGHRPGSLLGPLLRRGALKSERPLVNSP